MVQLPETGSLILLERYCRKVWTLSAISSPLKLPMIQRTEKHPQICHHEGWAALLLWPWIPVHCQPDRLLGAPCPGLCLPQQVFSGGATTPAHPGPMELGVACLLGSPGVLNEIIFTRENFWQVNNAYSDLSILQIVLKCKEMDLFLQGKQILLL